MKKKMAVAGTILSAVFLLLMGCGKKETEVVEVQEESEEEAIVAETVAETELPKVEDDSDDVDIPEEEVKDFSQFKYKIMQDGKTLFGFNAPQEYIVSNSFEGGDGINKTYCYRIYEKNIGDFELEISTEYELTENHELINKVTQDVESITLEKKSEVETDLGIAELYFTTEEGAYYKIENNEANEVVYDMHRELAALNINEATVTFWFSQKDEEMKSSVEEYTGQLEKLLPLLLAEATDKEFLENKEGLYDNFVEVEDSWAHVLYARETQPYVAVMGFNDVEGWEFWEGDVDVNGGINYVFTGRFVNENTGWEINTNQENFTNNYNFYFEKGASSIEQYEILQRTDEIGEVDSPFGKILLYKSVSDSKTGVANEYQFGIIRNNGINIWIELPYITDGRNIEEVLAEFFLKN